MPLEALLLRLEQSLRPVVRGWLGAVPNRELALDEIVLTTLEQAWRGLSACRAEHDQQVWRWVWRIARNVRWDWMREQRTARALLPLEAVRLSAAAIADDAPGSDGVNEASNGVVSLLMRCHDALPDAAMLLLWLRIVRSASFAEIARELGTTEAGAKRRWQRVTKRLARDVVGRVALVSLRAERESRMLAQGLLNTHGSSTPEPPSADGCDRRRGYGTSRRR